MGWIKSTLPEPDTAEYQEAMEEAYEDFLWWVYQDEAMKNKEGGNDERTA